MSSKADFTVSEVFVYAKFYPELFRAGVMKRFLISSSLSSFLFVKLSIYRHPTLHSFISFCFPRYSIKVLIMSVLRQTISFSV